MKWGIMLKQTDKVEKPQSKNLNPHSRETAFSKSKDVFPLLEERVNPQDEIFLIQKKIHHNYGFDLGIYQENRVRRAIEERVSVVGANSLQQYYAMLDKEEFKNLLNHFAINESRFFRDANVYEEFSKILSSLIKEKRKTSELLRIWSAGCACGEEPYSIAMMLKETAGKIDFPYSIIATDIDEDALGKAKRAAYEKWGLRETKGYYMKYFEGREGKYFLSDEIKKMVLFLRHNMTKDSIGSYFDVIFCRNVMLYFNKKTQNKMYELFYNSLKDYGFLAIGKGEVTSYTDCEKFFHTYVFKENVYIKKPL